MIIRLTIETESPINPIDLYYSPTISEYYRFEQSFIIWHDKITLVGVGIIAYRNAERMDVRPSPVEILMTK